MLLPSTTPRPHPRIVRVAAFLLLVLQGLVAVAPALEHRPAAGAPVVHVEQTDTQHADMQHNDRCVVCTTRSVLATRPAPDASSFGLSRIVGRVESPDKVATPSEAPRDNPSRAPPAIA